MRGEALSMRRACVILIIPREMPMLPLPHLSIGMARTAGYKNSRLYPWAWPVDLPVFLARLACALHNAECAAVCCVCGCLLYGVRYLFEFELRC